MPRLQYRPDLFVGELIDTREKISSDGSRYLPGEFGRGLLTPPKDISKYEDLKPFELSRLRSAVLDLQMGFSLLQYSLKENTLDFFMGIPKVIFNQPVYTFSPMYNTLRYYFLGTFGEAQLSDERIRDYVAHHPDDYHDNEGLSEEGLSEEDKPSHFLFANHDKRPGLFAYRKLWNPVKWLEFAFAIVFETVRRTLDLIVPLLATIAFMLISPVGAIFQELGLLINAVKKGKSSSESESDGWTLRSVASSAMMFIAKEIYSIAGIASVLTFYTGALISDIIYLSFLTANYFLEAFTSPLDTVVRPFKSFMNRYPVTGLLSLVAMTALAGAIMVLAPPLLFPSFAFAASSVLPATPFLVQGFAFGAVTLSTLMAVWAIPATAKTMIQTVKSALVTIIHWCVTKDYIENFSNLSGAMQGRLPSEPIVHETQRDGLNWALGLQEWTKPLGSYAKSKRRFDEDYEGTRDFRGEYSEAPQRYGSLIPQSREYSKDPPQYVTLRGGPPHHEPVYSYMPTDTVVNTDRSQYEESDSSSSTSSPR